MITRVTASSNMVRILFGIQNGYNSNQPQCIGESVDDYGGDDYGGDDDDHPPAKHGTAKVLNAPNPTRC
jgi:hypothetical protein